jgi:hypothetical protein
MLTINLVTETYDWPCGDEEPAQEPSDSDIRTESVSFRELVSIMREYSEPSCYPPVGADFEWLSRSETDYRTGADTVESLHYARENPTRNLKYWRAAMKAAGFVK